MQPHIIGELVIDRLLQSCGTEDTLGTCRLDELTVFLELLFTGGLDVQIVVDILEVEQLPFGLAVLGQDAALDEVVHDGLVLTK